MRKLTFFSLSCLIILVSFQCESTNDGDVEKNEVNTSQNILTRVASEAEFFPRESQLLGMYVAENLELTIRNLHAQGIDYSDADNSKEFRERFYTDFLRAYPNSQSMGITLSDLEIDSREFVKRVHNLTEKQIHIIEKIITVCNARTPNDTLYQDFLKINKEILDSIPQKQQERLFNTISVLYYGLKKIEELKLQGLMINRPSSQLERFVRRKTPREGDSGSLSSACRKFISSVWIAAIDEPTPYGEIVVGVAAIIYLGALVYEYVTCPLTATQPTNDYNYCQDRFEHCTSPIPDGCSVCLQFCLNQGYWPSYSTHQCS